jgi:hypothetical protein
MILTEYFEIWIIESNLNSYCLNCSESQSSEPGRTNLYGHDTLINIIKIKELSILPDVA